MLFTLRQLAVSLIVTTSLVGCYRSDVPSEQPESARPPEVVSLEFDDLFDPELYVICDEHEAETIIVVYVTIPNVMDTRPFRIPLCRPKIRKLEYSRRSMGFAADGQSREGFGIGYRGSIGIDEATDSSVQVSLSLSWTATDRTRGSFDVLLPITVGQPSEKDIDGDIKIRWVFEPPVALQDEEN